MTEATSPSVPVTTKKKRARKSPSESLVATFTSLSLSELTKFADSIVKADVETARFLHGRLANHLQGQGGS